MRWAAEKQAHHRPLEPSLLSASWPIGYASPVAQTGRCRSVIFWPVAAPWYPVLTARLGNVPTTQARFKRISSLPVPVTTPQTRQGPSSSPAVPSVTRAPVIRIDSDPSLPAYTGELEFGSQAITRFISARHGSYQPETSLPLHLCTTRPALPAGSPRCPSLRTLALLCRSPTP